MNCCAVRFAFAGLGRMGAADYYTHTFEDWNEATEFRDRVNEGRDEARWQVRCSSGERRRLGTATSASLYWLVERRRSAATSAVSTTLPAPSTKLGSAHPRPSSPVAQVAHDEGGS